MSGRSYAQRFLFLSLLTQNLEDLHHEAGK